MFEAPKNCHKREIKTGKGRSHISPTSNIPLFLRAINPTIIIITHHFDKFARSGSATELKKQLLAPV